MEEYVVDLTGVKTWYDLHDVLKNSLEFPDYYGMNLGALWDCLTDFTEPAHITIKGIETLPRDLDDIAEKIVMIFERAAKEKDYFYFTVDGMRKGVE